MRHRTFVNRTCAWLLATAVVMALGTGVSSAQAQPPAPGEPVTDPVTDATPASSLQFKGFGDIQFRATDTTEVPSTFALGQLDFFVTSAVGGAWSVLAELVVEANAANQIAFEIERMQLQYFPNDHLRVIFGRYHASIGYYNTAYHHGTWFQTAVGRPQLFAFEDEGGILPVHDVGVSASGLLSSRGLGLHWVAEIGNGRNWHPDAEAVQNERDLAAAKAINLGGWVRPARLPGFQAGASWYRDRLDVDGQRVTSTMIATHVVYDSPRFEWLNEWLWIRHQADGQAGHLAPAGYSQAAYRVGRGRPFARYEYIDANAGHPLLGAIGGEHGPSLGARFDITPAVAFKAQYDRRVRSEGATSNGLAVQLAFTF